MYPVRSVTTTYTSCDEWVKKATKGPVADRVSLGRTLPLPLDLGRNLYPARAEVTPVPGVPGQYRILFTFGVNNKRILLFRPTWDNMTASQVSQLNALYDLVLVHEKGHKNILHSLMEKFKHNEKHFVHPAQSETEEHAADRLAGRLYDEAKVGLGQDDQKIEELYDIQTNGGFKQSVFGGMDYPSLERICLPITSTFDVDDEKWTATGDAVSQVPTYHASGGNPGGFIEIVDQAIEQTWYWVAPPKYLGDRSEAYGTFLTFELKQSALDRPYEQVDVRISGGGGTLVKRFGSPPGLDWTLYFLALDVTGGWVVEATNAPATQEQIQSTLDSLISLQIRGEYRIGADTGGLDNVAFGVPQ